MPRHCRARVRVGVQLANMMLALPRTAVASCQAEASLRLSHAALRVQVNRRPRQTIGMQQLAYIRWPAHALLDEGRLPVQEQDWGQAFEQEAMAASLKAVVGKLVDTILEQHMAVVAAAADVYACTVT